MEQPSDRARYKDEWGTGAREGYEDRGSFRPPRAPKKQPGSSLLRTLGAITIVAGVFWGTYLVTQGGDIVATLQQNRGPVAIVALGLVVSLVGKYVRV